MLKPTHPAADYKVRIFTTEKELPFAGHPTLGTAHALLEAGLTPKRPGTVMQECGVGLVAVNIQPEGTLAFAAPEVEFRPMAAEETERLTAALLTRDDCSNPPAGDCRDGHSLADGAPAGCAVLPGGNAGSGHD